MIATDKHDDEREAALYADILRLHKINNALCDELLMTTRKLILIADEIQAAITKAEAAVS